MDYINEYGKVIKIPVSDEVWLDDAFFEREMSKLPPDAPRAGLAYRVSTKGQVDHDDIPMQKIECRKFCVQHGWRVVAEKSEKGVSGSKVSAQKRDAIQYFKSIAENGEIDILLLYIFDRLGRIESEVHQPQGFEENREIAKRGGSYAGETRKSIEADTGRSIITSENAVQLNTVVTDMIEGVVNAEDKEGENKK